MATSTKKFDTARKSCPDKKKYRSPTVQTPQNPGQNVPDYTSDLAEAELHLQNLGENLANICVVRKQHFEMLQSSEKLSKKLRTENKKLHTQLTSVEKKMSDKISSQDSEIANLKTTLAENALTISHQLTKENELKTEIEQVQNRNEQLNQDVRRIETLLSNANSMYEEKVGQFNQLTDETKLLKSENARISNDLVAEREYLNCLVEEQMEIRRRPSILNKLVSQHKWSSGDSIQTESFDTNNGNNESLDSTRKRKHDESTSPENGSDKAKRSMVGPSVSDALPQNLCGERQATVQTDTNHCSQRESKWRAFSKTLIRTHWE